MRYDELTDGERAREGWMRGNQHEVQTEPHPFQRVGWRWWLCRHCFAPRSLHPRKRWVKARPVGDRRYFSADAPHFKEGW